MKERLHKENGKLYVLLCGCNPMEKTEMPYLDSEDKFGGNRINLVGKCTECGYNSWYIKEA